MKSLTHSKIDRTVSYIQIIIIIGVFLSYLIDPAYMLFGALFSIPASVIVLIYFITKAVMVKGFKVYFRVIFISLIWPVLCYWFIWYLFRDFPSW